MSTPARRGRPRPPDTTPMPSMPRASSPRRRPGPHPRLVSLLLAPMMELIDDHRQCGPPHHRRIIRRDRRLLQGGRGLPSPSGSVDHRRPTATAGRRRLFVLGLIGFTLACGVRARAGDRGAGRLPGGPGIAAAAMVPRRPASIQVMYAPHERGMAMGIFSGLAGLAGDRADHGAVPPRPSAGGGSSSSTPPVGVVALSPRCGSSLESRAARRPHRPAWGCRALARPPLALLYPLTVVTNSAGPRGRMARCWPAWPACSCSSRAPPRAPGHQPLLATSLYGRAFTGGTPHRRCSSSPGRGISLRDALFPDRAGVVGAQGRAGQHSVCADLHGDRRDRRGRTDAAHRPQGARAGALIAALGAGVMG